MKENTLKDRCIRVILYGTVSHSYKAEKYYFSVFILALLGMSL